jgi:DNA-binding PadR family transcriptional regulator
MTAVFSHSRLRLYLLKLLDDGPKHGYELIRLLENRFHGHYAPSAGTIYPRLARLENEGQVRHTAAGGRKTYEITDSGRAELRARSGELDELERDILASVQDLTVLATEIEQGVRGSVRDLKRELRDVERQARGRWQPTVIIPSPTPGASAEQEAFDRRLEAFTAEVRALVHRRRLSDEQLRVATRLLDGALDGLRKLGRG